MHSQSWTYLDERGGKHEVNLYHSPRDGKLLVQVDKQTVIATVHAHKGGRWTFMVEDELCDVVLFRRGIEFFYGFEINRHADTPRNRAIKIRNRRDFWLPMGIFLAALAICSTLIFGRNYFFKKNERPAGDVVEMGSPEQIARLNLLKKTTVATLSTGARAVYSFKTFGEKTFGGSFILKKNAAGQPILSNGLPLENGDEFEVEFLPENPAVHRLKLTQPTENQLVVYENRAAAIHQVLHPNEPERYSICLARLARKRTGLRGLNDIFYQNYSPDQNPEHNRETFARLVRDEIFKKMLLDSCLE